MLALLSDMVILVYFLIILLGIFLYRRLDSTFRIVFWSIIYIIIHENNQYLLPASSSTHLSAHLYCVVMCILFYAVFRTLMIKSSIWKYTNVIFAIVLTAMILNSLFLQDLRTLPTISINLLQLFVVIQSCIFFLYLLNQPNSIPIFRDAVFWFNTSTFIYYSTSYFIFTIPYFLITNHVKTDNTGAINIILCLIYYPIIGYTFYLNANRLKYESRN